MGTYAAHSKHPRRRGERRPARLRSFVMSVQPKHILVADDEPGIVAVLDKYLADEGFVVTRAYDGAEAIAAFEKQPADLIVLDLKMPVMSGLDVFREIRSKTAVPIIMLTSKTDEVDKILGLELGADDYITKPFSPREVVARVKNVLRRAASNGAVTPSPPAQELIRAGDLEIDLREHEVRLRGSTLNLTPTEFRILMVLAASPGQTFTRPQLLEMIRKDDFEIFDRTLDRHIANLRHKVEDDPAVPRMILTVFGVGYKMARKP
jgi:DNA-binding response OmpR family regulator